MIMWELLRDNWFILMLLLCPLMHLFMHKHHHGENSSHDCCKNKEETTATEKKKTHLDA
ncbi:DUF2933 domain-containing protein [Proteus sp. GOKU]|uniref:DUF2933 domain-containing protein n=2 Tax=Morganellaceae TaxID=1903414 RepID=A0ABX6JNE5_9GAMM|nr:DUF2933 domain-containing protein [Proteus sp. G2618]QGW03626.1 DUF2933 domain-containing protein [Proteus terrae subsp. cibarius]QIF89365.1 DUF2933 domain-containing protein [Proteus terrae subsp. cibarius]QPB80004.1 DUF2933 domain-containing protein [Proteus sp. GOKU]QQP26011.1 DUF2933 domain-containing protein [Proteus vulgaris]